MVLHVINLNIMVLDNRVFDDFVRSADQQLKRLSERLLSSGLSVRLRIRVGNPAQEILAEQECLSSNSTLSQVF